MGGGRNKSNSGLEMPPLVLEKIQRKPLQEKLLFFSLESVSQLHVDSQKHVCAPDLASMLCSGGWCGFKHTNLLMDSCSQRRQQPPTASRSHRPALVRWPARVCSAGKIGRFPCNLPAQLFTSRGLPLSHELLYGKAKLSS